MSRLLPLKARTEALTALTGKFRGHEGDDAHIAAACDHLRNAQALVTACERLEVSLDPVRLELTLPNAGDTSYLSALLADSDGCVAGKRASSSDATLNPGGFDSPASGAPIDLHKIPGQKPPVPCFTPDPSKFFGKPKNQSPSESDDSRSGNKPEQEPVSPGKAASGNVAGCTSGNTSDDRTTYVLLLPSPNGKGYAGRLFDACQRCLEEAEKLLVE